MKSSQNDDNTAICRDFPARLRPSWR